MRTLRHILFCACAIGLALQQVAIARQETPTPSPTSDLVNKPRPRPAATAMPGGALVLVPGGTLINVALTEPLSSGTANVNDPIGIVVKREVDVDGFVVVPAGSEGEATVTSVDRAGGNGHGGQLAITVDYVFSIDGGKIKLSNTNHYSENGDQKGAASTATILTYIFLSPLGLFAHNFVRGKDVTIGTDKVFTVFVDHDIHVNAKEAASSSGYDQ